MKRTLFFIVLIVMMFGLSAQNYMLIYKTDGSIVVCGTAEIDSLKFVQEEIYCLKVYALP